MPFKCDADDSGAGAHDGSNGNDDGNGDYVKCDAIYKTFRGHDKNVYAVYAFNVSFLGFVEALVNSFGHASAHPAKC